MITPFDDFVYLVNNVLLGEEPTIEDFILLIGTIVAFVAFVLWCCFPVVPKETQVPIHYEGKDYHIRLPAKKKLNSLPREVLAFLMPPAEDDTH